MKHYRLIHKALRHKLEGEPLASRANRECPEGAKMEFCKSLA